MINSNQAITRSPISAISAANNIKGSSWHHSYAFGKLQKLLEQYYIDSAIFQETDFKAVNQNVGLNRVV